MAIDVVVRLGLSVAEIVAVAHFFGRPLGSIRPELIFLDPAEPESPTLLPRCEPYLALARAPLEGHGLLFDRVFSAPEILGGRPHSVESDVFAFATTLAFWLGHYPFGDTIPGQLDAIIRGQPRLEGIDPALARLLGAALEVDPGRRPPMKELCERLEAMRG